MKKSFLFVGTPLIAMMLLTGCSTGETPRLSDPSASESTVDPTKEGTQSASDEATDGTKETGAPKDSEETPKGSEETPKDSGESPTKENSDPKAPSEDLSDGTPEATDELITAGEELPKDTFGQNNDEPINLPAPEYKVENDASAEFATEVDPAITSSVTTVFNTYIKALKAKDWETACSTINYDPAKGLAFCIDTLSSQQWDPSKDFTIENSIGSQDSVSGVVTFTKKSESTTDREVVRFAKNDKGEWKIIIPSLAA